METNLCKLRVVYASIARTINTGFILPHEGYVQAVAPLGEIQHQIRRKISHRTDDLYDLSPLQFII